MENLLDKSPEWELMVHGNPTPMENVTVTFSSSYSRRSFPRLDESMERLWQEELKKNSRLYNGSKFRLQSATTNLQVNLCVGLTDFKETICTNHSNRLEGIQAHGKSMHNDLHACFGDALGVGGVVVTKDDFIVLIKRSDWVAEAKGCLDTPGGHAEPEYMLNKLGVDKLEIFQVDVSHVVHEIFHSFVREVVDEVNIPESSLSWPILLGVLRNNEVGGKPGMIFTLRCSLTRDKVEELYLKGGLEADESTAISFVPVKELLAADSKDVFAIINLMAPLGKAAMLLYRHHYDHL